VLKLYSLSSTYLESGWAIHPLSGALLKFSDAKVPSFRAKKLPLKVSSALALCMEPYQLNPAPNLIPDLNSTSEIDLKKIYSRLSYLRRKSFLLSVFYTSLRRPIYETSFDAMSDISRLFPEDLHAESCLQKALTVAKVSKKFKSHGVLFIGAQLPLKSMHAWIIEDGIQPDQADRKWVNYLPLLALAY
jgi:hypothetical protein